MHITNPAAPSKGIFEGRHNRSALLTVPELYPYLAPHISTRFFKASHSTMWTHAPKTYLRLCKRKKWKVSVQLIWKSDRAQQITSRTGSLLAAVTTWLVLMTLGIVEPVGRKQWKVTRTYNWLCLRSKSYLVSKETADTWPCYALLPYRSAREEDWYIWIWCGARSFILP